MNVYNIIKNRKKDKKDIIYPWKVFTEKNVEKIGYLFSIHSTEDFNGDMTGIEELYDKDVIYLDFINKNKNKNNYRYINLKLLYGFPNLTQIALHVNCINSINEFAFFLYCYRTLKQVKLYDSNGRTRYIAVNIEDDNVASFCKRLKYRININNLIK